MKVASSFPTIMVEMVTDLGGGCPDTGNALDIPDMDQTTDDPDEETGWEPILPAGS